MAKYLIQDIIPPNKKSRQAGEKRSHNQEERKVVFTPAGGTRREGAPVSHDEGKHSGASFSVFSGHSGDGRSFIAQWFPWLLGMSIFAVLVISVFNYFSGATVTILPKRDTIPLDQGFTALKSPSIGNLPYAIMKLTLTESKEVPATGQKTVTEKASGKLVVYNTQTVSQRLIKNTRFQNSDGKIYRINESITVPKATVQGSKITPGTLAVTVYADQPGQSYNSEADDFTLPGLKGSPLFEKVYARSNGPISGGASGTIKTISDEDMRTASEDLRITLETKLRTKAKNDIAPSQIGYASGIVVELEKSVLASTQASSEDRAVVTQEGTLYMTLFDRKELSRALARALVPSYGGEELIVSNIEELTFEMPAATGRELWTNDKLQFALQGAPRLEWVVDEAVLKKELLNTPKTNFNIIMAKYTNIERAKATLYPFWKKSFPSDPENIIVEVVEVMEE